MSSIPLSAMTSASETFATVIPVAPALSCSLATEGILCVLTWGLSFTPRSSAIPDILAMFLFICVPSIRRYGVSNFPSPLIGADIQIYRSDKSCATLPLRTRLCHGVLRRSRHMRHHERVSTRRERVRKREDRFSGAVQGPTALAVFEGFDRRGRGGLGGGRGWGESGDRAGRGGGAVRLSYREGPVPDRRPLPGALPRRLLPGRTGPDQRPLRHRAGPLGHKGQGPGRPRARTA